MTAPAPEDIAAATRLPEEILVEIVAKLPLKSLVRFRCVSKYWFDLIKSPKFIEMHLKHHSYDNECIIVVRGVEESNKILLSFHSHETLDIIVSSPHLEIPHINVTNFDVCEPSNGLICVSDDTNIVLCNPTTRQIKLLPLSPSLSLPCPGRPFARNAIGFGFDSGSNDYKVVTFGSFEESKDGRFSWPHSYTPQLEIYKLSTDSWTSTEAPRIFCDSYDFQQCLVSGRFGTLFNGAFHWVAMVCEMVLIISFNMSTEELSYFPFSVRGELVNIFRQKCLKVFDGSLAFITYGDPFYGLDSLESKTIYVWVMHEFGVAESLRLKFTFVLSRIRHPLTFWKNEAFLMENKEGRLVSYPFCTRKVKKLDIRGSSLQAMVYRERLVFIK